MIKHLTWQDFFKSQESLEYFSSLIEKVNLGYQNNILFPLKENLFKAFKLCSFNQLKVVILGQDPYHDENQANGLAFSVNNIVKTPPSLRNIFLEIYKEYGKDRNALSNGNDLSDWAKQGVLLANTFLTVKKHQPESCKDWGWNIFTKNLINFINDNKQNVVFVALGKHSESVFSSLNLKNGNILLKTSHPSPFSAHRGFLGSNIFKKINEYLQQTNQSQIDW